MVARNWLIVIVVVVVVFILGIWMGSYTSESDVRDATEEIWEDVVDDIEEVGETLIEAHERGDRVAFDQAIKKLANSFGSLAGRIRILDKSFDDSPETGVTGSLKELNRVTKLFGVSFLEDQPLSKKGNDPLGVDLTTREIILPPAEKEPAKSSPKPAEPALAPASSAKPEPSFDPADNLGISFDPEPVDRSAEPATDDSDESDDPAAEPTLDEFIPEG